MSFEKAEKRRLFKEKLSVLGVEEKARKSRLIVSQLNSFSKLLDATVIAGFVPTAYEPNLISLFSKIVIDKELVLPYSVNGTDYEFKICKNLSDLEKGPYSIYQPIASAKTVAKDSIQFVFVPGVVFSKNGNRIGHGKGIYDRLLENCNAYKLGICFLEQLDDNFLVNDWDIQLDRVIFA